MFETKNALEDFILKLDGVSDIHFTRWHYRPIEFRIRERGLLRMPEWSECAEQLWGALMWHGALLQRDLSQPQHAMIRLERSALRLSYAPTALGQRLVVRLHAYQAPKVEASLMPALKETGLTVLYGKTGSGKTTKAYQWLDEMSCSSIVISIEDPPECLSQLWTQFDRSVANDEGVHHLVLRQNPDVLFWGELRDRYAWTMIENWVTTGHHVLTTMHASSPEQCYDRLNFLGAAPDFLERYLHHLELCSYTANVYA